MSTIFVAVHCARGSAGALEAIARARPWAPLADAAEQVRTHRARRGGWALGVWTRQARLMRGTSVDASYQEGSVTCLDGWVVERAHPTRSIAGAVARQIAERSFPEVAAGLQGGWSMLHLGGDGRLWAGRDGLGTRPLYWGKRGQLWAVSNRASMIAHALASEGSPPLQVQRLAWWASRPGASPREEGTLWAGVSGLEPGWYVSYDGERARVIRQREPEPLASLEAAHEELVARCAAFARLPDVDAQIVLGPGPGPRCVLAAILAAGTQGRLARAVIAPDDELGQALAARHDLPRHLGPLDDLEPASPEERLARHLFVTEGHLHPWVLEAGLGRWPSVVLTGEFAELFEGPRVGRPWPWEVWRRRLVGTERLDPFGVLSPLALARVRGEVERWLQRERARGMGRREVAARWHRARSRRHAAARSQARGLGRLWMSPLADARLLEWSRRRGAEALAQLTARANRWCARQPARARQQQQEAPWDGLPEAARALVQERGGDDFHEVFEAQAVARLLERVDQGDDQALRVALGLWGARVVMRGGVEPRRVRAPA